MWARCLSKGWWIHPVGLGAPSIFISRADFLMLSRWKPGWPRRRVWGAAPEASRGQQGWEVQGMMLTCRWVLQEQVWCLRACGSRGETCCGITPTSSGKAWLAHPAYLSPQCSCWIGHLMCVMFPGNCFSKLVFPASGRYPPLLLFSWFPSGAPYSAWEPGTKRLSGIFFPGKHCSRCCSWIMQCR